MTYTSHADLGGRDIPGAIVPEPEGEPFHAAWEARVLALTLAMGGTGSWNIDASRSARETLPNYARLSYYQIWLAGLEKLMAERSQVLPDLPTLDESGLKGYQIVGWNGLFLPAGTPPAIVDKLHIEVVKALALADLKERLATMGFEGVGDTPQHFAAFVQAEIAKWAKVVKDADIKVE